MDKYLIGIDIGGTKCAVIVGRQAGEGEENAFDIKERTAFATEVEKGPEYAINRLFSLIREMMEKHGLTKENVKAFGISCGGPLDHVKGLIQSPPNLPGWDNVPVVKMLEDEFGIPAYLQNDANACALAEWKFGAARGYDNVIFLTCGSGMGAGLILNGRLYTGKEDMAGEVGHVRLSETGPVGYGKAGSFEGFCSGNGIGRVARIMVTEKLQMGEKPALCPEISALSELSAKKVAAFAREGDPLAKEIYEVCGRYMGQALSLLIDILNPEVIVLGSVYERSGELLAPSMMKVIEKETLEPARRGCRIVPAKLGDAIGDYAALSVAVNGGEE